MKAQILIDMMLSEQYNSLTVSEFGKICNETLNNLEDEEFGKVIQHSNGETEFVLTDEDRKYEKACFNAGEIL